MLGVFSRFYKPPMWTMDLAVVTLVWTVMLAAAPALKRGEHMAITIIVDKLPQRMYRFVVFVRVIVYFIILLFMVVLGVEYAWSMRLFTIMSLDIHKTIPLMAIPVGMGLMLIMYSLSQFIPLDCKENNFSCKNDLDGVPKL
ncbi:TRAP transporter small permease [Arcobacter nitrofigilis]|nr:TRAP transporter small permease subunit [Arcobacter nitrofigilis]